MKIVETTITLEELKKMSEKMFGQIVKAVVDVERNILVVDAGMHSDMEEFLLDQEAEQEHLWGINLHPFEHEDKFIEFDSVINLRPFQGNRSRSVDDVKIQKKIIDLVKKKVAW